MGVFEDDSDFEKLGSNMDGGGNDSDSDIVGVSDGDEVTLRLGSHVRVLDGVLDLSFVSEGRPLGEGGAVSVSEKVGLNVAVGSLVKEPVFLVLLSERVGVRVGVSYTSFVGLIDFDRS